MTVVPFHGDGDLQSSMPRFHDVPIVDWSNDC